MNNSVVFSKEREKAWVVRGEMLYRMDPILAYKGGKP